MSISLTKLKALTPFQALYRSLDMVVRAAPKELRNLALLNLLTGVGPSISLFLSKIVIDEASRLIESGTAVECLVLDEPTAALDPKHEHELYNIFRQIARGRMTVVVSHRLALAKMADRIIVLEHGQIIEAGSHDTLMALGGQYCLMFTRQASSYV